MTDVWERAEQLPAPQRAAFRAWAAQTLARQRSLRACASPAELARSIDPTYVITPAIELMAEHLERATTTRGARKLITCPPQEGKSTLVAVWTVLRQLQRNPDTRILIASYSEDLARQASQAARNVIAANGTGAHDPLTGVELPDRLGLGLAGDRWAAGNWQIRGHKGGVVAVGMGGTITGRPCDCVSAETSIITREGPIPAAEFVALPKKPEVLSLNHSTGKPEWRLVEAVRTIPERPLVEIETDSGRMLRCTPDHRVHTQRGYVQAQLLTPGDRLTIGRDENSPGVREMRQGARNQGSHLLGLLPGTAEDARHADVCALPERISATEVRRRQEGAARVSGVLLEGMQSRDVPGGNGASMPPMRETYAGRAEPPVLLRRMPRGWPGEESAGHAIGSGEVVPGVRYGIPAEDITDDVLHADMCEQRAREEDDRARELALSGWAQLRGLVPQDAAVDPRPGYAPVCGVQEDPAAVGVPARGAGGVAVAVDRAPRRREPSEQPADELGCAVRRLPCSAPQIGGDTVRLVRRVRGAGHTVYDLQVEGNRNFFADEILVHNCLIIDDPLKGMAAADSPTERAKVIAGFQGDLSTRLAPGAPIILIQTRWHEQDLAGFLLAEHAETWTHINIPAVATPGVPDALARAEGVPLESARGRTPEEWEEIRHAVGERVWAALFLGSPYPLGGTLFSQSWFDRFRLAAEPGLYRRLVAVDPAETGKGDEAGIIAAGLVADGTVVLTEDWSGQLSSAEWPRKACLLALASCATELVFEAYSAATTYHALLKRAYEDLVQEAAAAGGIVEGVRVPGHRPFHLNPWKGSGNALVRSTGLRHATSAGRCRVVAHRLATLEAHAIRWQEGQHCPDRVAAATIAYDVLSGCGEMVMSPEPGGWGQMPDGISTHR